MKFDVGNDLRIQGVRDLVLGSILYEDRASNDRWEEYRLLNHDNRSESWLSYDEGNQEYEMSFMCNESTPPEGFRLVDSGTQVVRGRSGSVDVDRGETAQYETWEDAEELHTSSSSITTRHWSPGDRVHSCPYGLHGWLIPKVIRTQLVGLAFPQLSVHVNRCHDSGVQAVYLGNRCPSDTGGRSDESKRARASLPAGVSPDSSVRVVSPMASLVFRRA